MLHLTASHSSYIPYYFNLFSIISSLYSSAIMSRILCERYSGTGQLPAPFPTHTLPRIDILNLLPM